jgi:hypothetical protein
LYRRNQIALPTRLQVVFWIDNDNAPYVITKPLHHTQTLLSEEADGKIFSIKVILNIEF